MKYKIPLGILSILAIAYIGFMAGVRKSENRMNVAMTKTAQSIGYQVTEDEMLRLTVRMLYLVNELDIEGLLRRSDTGEASLMLIIYSLLVEGDVEKAQKLSGALMKGYLLGEDEDTDLGLQQKIRDILLEHPLDS